METLIERWFRHGREVHEWYEKICKAPSLTGDDRVIDWFNNYVPGDLKQYHFFHDCGKPFCQEIDENGKEHYPNHSEVSARKYIEMFGSGPVADMILHDMDFHRERGDRLTEIWQLPFADHLYATAWAEIFANAELFGGQESDSFKIKRKRLIQALKKRGW